MFRKVDFPLPEEDELLRGNTQENILNQILAAVPVPIGNE